MVERQLGRPARGLAGVAVVCPHGCPAVIVTRPYLEDGAPFPTVLYLTCPSARARISDLESAGGVGALRARLAAEPGLKAALAALDEVYKAGRRALAEAGGRPRTATPPDAGKVFERGVGGSTGPERLTCLHALAAALLAVLGGWPEGGAPDRDGAGEGTGVNEGTGGGQEIKGSEGIRRFWNDLLVGMGDLWCESADCRSGGVAGSAARAERRAALDVGTNSVRLLVADLLPEAGRLIPVPIVRRAEITRLGEGLKDGEDLGGEPKRRTRQAVERFVAEAKARGASAVTLVGTSAARRAADGVDFIRSLGAEFGVAAGVVPGRLEAILGYAGATLEVPGDAVMLDIGGGSTELVRWASEDQAAAVSLELGSVRATEDWLHSDPPAQSERRAVYQEALEGIERVASAYKGADALVGVAGTITTLAAHVLRLERYRPEAVHLSMLNRGDVERALGELSAMSLAARQALPYMQAGRADIIVAGAEILLAAMDALEYSLIVVSERDLLDGILLASA